MRTKAGIACVAIAVFALAALAATGLGARFTGVAKVTRPAAITAHASFPPQAAKAGSAQGKVLYGSATVSIPVASDTEPVSSVALGKCPPKSHIINGTLAALHGTQAQYFTIHGFGVASPKTWFVDVVNSNPTNPIKAIGFIVCEK
jgi:hypothetical protein